MKKRILNSNNVDSKYVNESYDDMRNMLNMSRALISDFLVLIPVLAIKYWWDILHPLGALAKLLQIT